MGEIGQAVEARKNFTIKRITLSILVVGSVLLVAVVGGYFYLAANLAPRSGDLASDPVTVNIPKGATTADIGKVLTDAGLIKSPQIFSFYARFKKLDGSFRSGEYRLSPTLDVDAIMAELRKGQGPILIKVTIPEGFNTKQIADLLQERGMINREKFMTLVTSGNFAFDWLKNTPHSELRLEGFLFPATYDFPKGSTEEEIIKGFLARFEQELTPEIRAAVAQRGLTIPGFVTMASLIEKEAQKAEDRPIIAGVFYKRLQMGMPLQSCATIQFLLGYAKPLLYNKDLEIKSPYNTYKNVGLPPAPIANPGSASLQAAAFPAKTDYLYFVAKPDGYHAFAKSFEEHLRNQKKYQQ